MARSWRPEATVDAALATELVEKQFPHLAPVTVCLLAAGWDNTAHVINGSLVFRFPRRSIAVPLISTEIQLLPWLASRVPLKIPVPEYVGEPSAAYRWPFAGYSMIRGRALPAARCSGRTRASLAIPLARFLAALHAIPADAAANHGAGFDVFDRLNTLSRRSLTDEGLSALIQAGVIDDRRAIDAILDAAPVITHPRTDVLVHGDLHAAQIILGDDDQMIGVIDWGDVHLGDPAVDLAAAHAILPRESHEVFLHAYGVVDDTTWSAARARATWHTVMLLASAADTGDADVVHDAREALERLTA
jgi:aminoglycoside phosphotransferase (APT) family kinase protein